MLDRRYVVRVVSGPGLNWTFLEALRTAGLVRVHKLEPQLAFDILPPSAKTQTWSTNVWATETAGQMRAMGYNAVVAPEWSPP